MSTLSSTCLRTLLKFYEDYNREGFEHKKEGMFVTLYLEGLLVLKTRCEEEGKELPEEIFSSPTVGSLVKFALTFYDNTDVNLGYGNWVTDTKGNSRGETTFKTDQDPTIVRRRSMSLSYGGNRFTRYWDVWSIAEMEYQEHIVSQCFPLIRSIVDEDDLGAEWVEKVVGRLLYSDTPGIRKMVLWELCTGGCGVEVREYVEGMKSFNSVNNAKKKKKNKNEGETKIINIKDLSSQFINDFVIPSLDSLRGHHNTNYVYAAGGSGSKSKSVDLNLLVEGFIGEYISSSTEDKKVVKEILGGLENGRLSVAGLRNIFNGVVKAAVEEEGGLEIDDIIMVKAVKVAREKVWLEPRYVRDVIYNIMGKFLANIRLKDFKEPWDVIYVLSLFPVNEDTTALEVGEGEGEGEEKVDEWFSDLTQFISKLPNGFKDTAAEVMVGMFIKDARSIKCSLGPMSQTEVPLALMLLAKLTTGRGEHSKLTPRHPPPRVLGGSGNGDLMMTRDGGMLAPPPQIEAVLAQAGEILKKEVMDLKHFHVDEGEKNSLAQRVRPQVDGERMLEVLAGGFVSSVSLGEILEGMMNEGVEKFTESEGVASVPYLKSLSCSLRCNASFPSSKAPSAFKQILSALFVGTTSASSSSQQKARSAFQLAKWESLSCLSERIFKGAGAEYVDRALAEEACDVVFGDLENCNEDVIPYLFNVGFYASSYLVGCSPPMEMDQMERIIEGLWKTVCEETAAHKRQVLTNKFCSVVFSPATLSVLSFSLPNGPLQKTLQMLLTERRRSPLLARCAVLHLCNSLKTSPHYIHWRDIVSELLVHKEDRVKLEDSVKAVDRYGFEGVKESSMTRAIALEYMSELKVEELGVEGVRGK
ncbi:hypothetical protein TL16_g05521 [Triparma laevis f. inornata]|uniref:Uncharacterized protein n=1 Tax=Triparma laevis f. inornata TaxID=1714386 RepID=A0A9W7ANA5_9STRA|nr:hypothetical protein TL16_g05521 [Triparma laevis f. inornata]